MISKYIIIEILSYIYNSEQISEICNKLNKRMLNMSRNEKNIITNICKE